MLKYHSTLPIVKSDMGPQTKQQTLKTKNDIYASTQNYDATVIGNGHFGLVWRLAALWGNKLSFKLPSLLNCICVIVWSLYYLYSYAKIFLLIMCLIVRLID